MVIKLPQRFYDDHRDRDLPSGAEVRRTKSHVNVDVTVGELAEIRSDAQHYVDIGHQLDREYLGLVSSARATLRAIDQQVEAELRGAES